MVQGLSHVTFVVRDLERAGDFLETVLDAERVYAGGEASFSLAPERFYLLAGVWIAVMQGEPHAARTYDHLAFKIAEADFEAWERRLRAAGVPLRAPRPRIPGEGRSLYFHDHDNHLFELHTGTLPERLRAYAGRVPGPDAA